jgi:hypothetical protein
MSAVIIFPRGQLSDFDREAMMGAGIVAVEADDPAAVVQVVPGVPLVGADDLFMAALHGLTSGGGGPERERFVAELHRRLKAREAAKEKALD